MSVQDDSARSNTTVSHPWRNLESMIAEAREMQETGRYINGSVFHAIVTEIDRLRIEEALRAAAGWRPIATAPKDGTYILANKRFLDAGWSPRVVRWKMGAWLTDPGDWKQEPTHWMPLREPPECVDEK